MFCGGGFFGGFEFLAELIVLGGLVVVEGFLFEQFLELLQGLRGFKGVVEVLGGCVGFVLGVLKFKRIFRMINIKQNPQKLQCFNLPNKIKNMPITSKFKWNRQIETF